MDMHKLVNLYNIFLYISMHIYLLKRHSTGDSSLNLDLPLITEAKYNN